jgi:hypothetical protein
VPALGHLGRLQVAITHRPQQRRLAHREQGGRTT